MPIIRLENNYKFPITQKTKNKLIPSQSKKLGLQNLCTDIYTHIFIRSYTFFGHTQFQINSSCHLV